MAIVGHERFYSQGLDINRLTAVPNVSCPASVLGGVCKASSGKAGLPRSVFLVTHAQVSVNFDYVYWKM